MNYKKACEIIKKKNPMSFIRSSLDYGTFYLFCLEPIDVSKNDSYNTGTIFPAVDKKTGKVFLYDITTDLKLYENAKKIE